MIVTEEENRKEVPLTKKTHKGEVEISEDLSMLEVCTYCTVISTRGVLKFELGTDVWSEASTTTL